MERAVPRTYNRAATAVVQGRLHVERAREELGLAVHILAELESSTGRGSDGVSRSSIRAVLKELEGTERALRTGWSG